MREELTHWLIYFQSFSPVEAGDKCLTAKSQFEDTWFQVTEDMLNISLPIKKQLFRPILKDLPTLPQGMEVLDYYSQAYVTFSIDEIGQEVLVDYIINYLNHFYRKSLTFTWEIEVL